MRHFFREWRPDGSSPQRGFPLPFFGVVQKPAKGLPSFGCRFVVYQCMYVFACARLAVSAFLCSPCSKIRASATRSRCRSGSTTSGSAAPTVPRRRPPPPPPPPRRRRHRRRRHRGRRPCRGRPRRSLWGSSIPRRKRSAGAGAEAGRAFPPGPTRGVAQRLPRAAAAAATMGVIPSRPRTSYPARGPGRRRRWDGLRGMP